MELLKLVVAVHATPTLVVMTEAGLLLTVLGGVPSLASFENMCKVEAAAGVAPDAVRRLGALGVIVEEDAGRLTQRLRLSNEEHDRLVSMAQGWWRIAMARSTQEGRALLYRLGAERFTDRVLLAWARSWPESAADPAWRELVALPQRWTPPVFPLSAADFMQRGVAKGPKLGEALRTAEASWIAADFPADKAKLAAIADAAAR